MENLKVYSGFVAAIVSVCGLTYFAVREHAPGKKGTLSQLAADRRRTYVEFLLILWFCGILFSISVFFFIAPRLPEGNYISLSWLLVIVPELIVGVLPAKQTLYGKLHNIFANVMAIGMVLTAALLGHYLKDGFAQVEAVITATMLVLGLLTGLDRKRYLFYELPFIFLSHLSIVTAIIGVR